MPNIDLICLANSYKQKRRCVAGLRTDGGGWVRPVSDRPHGELDYNQYKLSDRLEPRVLDVIRLGLAGPRPLPHQPENWLIDGTPWTAIARPAAAEHWAVIAAAVRRGPDLLNSRDGRMTLEECGKHPAAASLELIQPDEVRWHTERTAQGNRGRVRFRFPGAGYDLPLTDPAYLKPLTMLPPGDHTAEEIWMPRGRTLLLTVSLSEPYQGVCYKLVAAVIVVPESWERLFPPPV